MLLFQIDSFTDRPFSGNPAAVMLLPAFLEEERMQLIAREMNLSETAFLVPRQEGFDLRWFTPTTEVDLCGHATLASAHFLWSQGHLDPHAAAVFHTKSGVLTCRQGSGGWIEMDFPATPVLPTEAPENLAAALGAAPVWVGRSRWDLLVRLAEAAEVRALQPDLGTIAAIPARGVIVTAPGDAGFDFVSRFFAPQSGVPEDPVTGSAHCALAPYWHSELQRTRLRGYQASPRGGVVEVEQRADRVLLRGQAVSVLRCELLVS